MSDYGDSVKELGDFCLEISHEGFTRRQLYLLFKAFGSGTKAILSHGYVKVFFHHYEDAGSFRSDPVVNVDMSWFVVNISFPLAPLVSAFSTLKDVMFGLRLSSKMRRCGANDPAISSEFSYEEEEEEEEVPRQERILPVATFQPREADASRGNEDPLSAVSLVTTEIALNPGVVKRKVRRMREATVPDSGKSTTGQPMEGWKNFYPLMNH